MITLFGHGVTSNGSDIIIILGASTEFILTFILASLLGSLLSMKIPWRLYVGVLVVGYIGTFLVYLVVPDPSFFLLSFPIRIATQFPLLHVSILAYTYHKKMLTPTSKGLVFTYFIFFIHTMDYPFLRNNPDFTLACFAISLVIFFALSIFIPAHATEIIASIQLKKEQNLKNSFARFVPHEFLKFLNREDITAIEFGDHVQKRMSVLFSDIRSFTAFSESMTPEENFKFLNSYYSQMGPIIRINNGFIDKYIGDGIMALFDKQADDAVIAAIEMTKKLIEYNKVRDLQGHIPIKIGVGINTGDLTLGTIGEINRMEGTVISDDVNLAERIEGMTKIYGSSILISDQTYHSLKTPSMYSLRFIGQILTKGKSKSVAIWEIFDGDPSKIKERKQKTINMFEEAVSLYYKQNFQDALAMFRKVFEINQEDKATQIYIDRCEHFLKVGWDENFDGILSFESK